jgi:hypothetical protein
MKTSKILFLISPVLIFIGTMSNGQTLNWASLKSTERHTLNVNVGYDYAFTWGIGYGYQPKTKLPMLLNIEHSQPAGEDIFDDFKTKIGGQIRLYQINNFHFSAKVQGVFRRFENDYVRMLNFGSDMSAIIGYYKQTWFAAGEFGFDKAIVTNFKHSDLFREDFPGVKDGWYEPSTGGHFYYGLQTGVSFQKSDVTVKVGKVIEQDFQTNPAVPYFVQVGYNRRF